MADPVYSRAIVIVLDSVGIGELPDAPLYEDQGSNTLGNIAAAVAMTIPTLASMGLPRLLPLKGIVAVGRPDPVGAREQLPVDVFQIIALLVVAVLAELGAVAVKRAAMQAREKPLDDGARLQLERSQARDHRGVEKPQLAGPHLGRHGYRPDFGTGTLSSSRETMPSELMRSDSA